MDNKCIGVFDSGLGGLTAVKQIINELPKEDIIYFGDTGRVPYGSRSKETLLKYTRGDIRFLNTFDVKIIVIACGTASSAALPAIKDEFDVPIIGVIDAAVYAAVRATKNKKIGVIGTARCRLLQRLALCLYRLLKTDISIRRLRELSWRNILKK